ncbi:hypothetical protein Q2T40_08465 [Winogradskyella maritima]|nr:hypothetical protein [Winogradskyella maritima]
MQKVSIINPIVSNVNIFVIFFVLSPAIIVIKNSIPEMIEFIVQDIIKIIATPIPEFAEP